MYGIDDLGHEASLQDPTRRLGQELGRGNAVIVNSGLGSLSSLLGWWRVEGGTGTTLGIGPDGWGGVSAEQLITLNATVRFAMPLGCLALAWYTRADALKVSLCLFGAAAGIGGTLGSFAGQPVMSAACTVISGLLSAAGTAMGIDDARTAQEQAAEEARERARQERERQREELEREVLLYEFLRDRGISLNEWQLYQERRRLPP
jgi:hypothetical protein